MHSFTTIHKIKSQFIPYKHSYQKPSNNNYFLQCSRKRAILWSVHSEEYVRLYLRVLYLITCITSNYILSTYARNVVFGN